MHYSFPFPSSLVPCYVRRRGNSLTPKPKRRPLWGDQRGISLIEVLVTIGLFAIIGGIAIPNLNSSSLNLTVALEQILGDVRMARADAITRGAHYRVTLSSESYSVERLQDDDGDGIWEPVGTAKTVDLPTGIAIVIENGDGVIEFNTRGLVTALPDGTPAEIEELVLSDTARGKNRDVEIWPSGQIMEV